MDKIKLDWREVRSPVLSEEEKNALLLNLNRLARKSPRGFDYEIAEEKVQQTLEFLKELDVVVEEVGQGSGSVCVAIYQNNSDRANRERGR